MSGSLAPAGPIAQSMADLWWLMLWLGLASFVVFLVALGLAIRHRGTELHPQDHTPEDRERPSRWWIIGGGVVQPLVLIAIVFGATLVAMKALPDEGPEGALVVEVIGHQWWYEVRYPDQGVETAGEIHIPVGQPVELRLSSADVVHSFWVPELAGKTDLLPDHPTRMVIQADRAGTYSGNCAEFCGLQHTRMGIVVVAVEAQDFEDHIAALAEPAAEPTDALAARGRDVFLANDCIQCHTIDGTGAAATDGPVLTHFGSRETLAARTLQNTPRMLAAWIADPHQFKEGVEMPATDLAPDDLEALVAYLQGLQ